jgi:hypothetical protein
VHSSVSTIRHGAPVVACVPANTPSRSQRWTVLIATPSCATASSAVNGPSCGSRDGLRGHFGMSWSRRMQRTASWVNGLPLPPRRRCLFKIRAICVSSDSQASLRTRSTVSSGVDARPPSPACALRGRRLLLPSPRSAPSNALVQRVGESNGRHRGGSRVKGVVTGVGAGLGGGDEVASLREFPCRWRGSPRAGSTGGAWQRWFVGMARSGPGRRFSSSRRRRHRPIPRARSRGASCSRRTGEAGAGPGRHEGRRERLLDRAVPGLTRPRARLSDAPAQGQRHRSSCLGRLLVLW